MRARLISLDGGPPVELTKDLTLVGRAEESDVRIDHKSVSKTHCVLAKSDGLVVVRDLGSTNGTRVNGQRVRRAILLPNDTIAFANFKYQLKLGNASEDRTNIDGYAVASVDAADDENDTPPPVDGSRKKRDPDPPIRRNVLPDIYPDAQKP